MTNPKPLPTKAMQLLQAQLDNGLTLLQVAELIGYSRTAVSLYANGKYERDATALEAALLRVFDTRLCPHLQEVVAPDTCTRKALSPRPFGGHDRRIWWDTCQSCRFKPSSPSSKEDV